MAKPIRPLIYRRLAAGLGLAVFAAALIFLHGVLRVALQPAGLDTGLILYALIVALTLFNARKKFPFLPLLRASTWMQFHVYTGWLAVLVFLLHTNWSWPHGTMEQILEVLFILVALSGVFGLLISRWLPARMTRSGEPIIYERIPALRIQLREHVEARVRHGEETTASSSLSDFYVRHLRAYLNRKPGWWLALAGVDPMLLQVRTELQALERYLNPDEQAIARELEECIEAKRDLDYQYAGNRLLKLWLFVHIPLSYSLIILGLVHGCLAIRYTIGWF
ncbi:MAG TPA: hypothetical protein VNU49_01790 [Opitutaceae bacterium]|jgi:hypothetical protein|nr:hypothetical protein [Opitutaceae bacterium]